MKRRLLIVIVSCGALLLALHFMSLKWMMGDVPVSGAKRSGEVLSPVDLTPSERIKVEYTSAGCRSWCTWLFELSGGSGARLVVVDAGSSESVGPTPSPVGVMSLSAKERRGLRDLLDYYRKLRPGDDSTTTSRIRVEYFRADEKIGEEEFVDRSSVEFWVDEKEQRSSMVEDGRPVISPEMVSFQTLFRRAWREAHPVNEAGQSTGL